MPADTTRFSRRHLIYSFLLGAGLTALIFLPQGLSTDVWRDVLGLREQSANLHNAPEPTWPPKEFKHYANWALIGIDDNNEWSTSRAGTYEEFGEHLQDIQTHYADNAAGHRIAIPVLPSVYTPEPTDDTYYRTLLNSRISEGDKVLVIGCGSGVDSWVAWTKSQSKIYALDINPMAVVNTRVTAQLAGFQVEAIAGDFRDVNLPDSFTDFDYVLWNMPYLTRPSEDNTILDMKYYDGDDGTILDAFLKRLPTLLKPDGTAIMERSCREGVHHGTWRGIRVAGR